MTDKPSIDIGAIGANYNPPRKSSSGGNGGSGGRSSNKRPGTGFTFYKLHTAKSDKPSKPGDKPNYTITKFDEDLNVQSGPYNLSYLPSNNGGYYDCSCPASKFDCRHKGIMRHIIEAGKVDSEAFFCFETRTFKLAEEIE